MPRVAARRKLLTSVATFLIIVVGGCTDGGSFFDVAGSFSFTLPVRNAEARSSDGTVQLFWQDPVVDTLQNIGVSWDPSGTEETLVLPGVENATITGLTNGTLYTIQIRAYSSDLSPSPPVELYAIPSIAQNAPSPASPQILLVESGGSTIVTEGTTVDTVDVSLSIPPTSVVDIEMTPATEIDLGNGAGASAFLSFDTTNWDISQSITVSALDNIGYQGGRTSTVSVNSVSTDPDYGSLAPLSFSVSIVDDEQPLQIYVTDNNNVEYFEDMTGLNWTAYAGGANGANNFSSLSGIAVSAGRVYVADSGSLFVSYFDDMLGTNHTESPALVNPTGITVYSGAIYVSENSSSSPIVYEMNAALSIVSNLDLSGIVTTPFPSRIHVDSTGFYVGDNALAPGRVHQFTDMAGTGLSSYDGSAGPTWFANVRDIATDSTGRIYVVDAGTALVYRFDDIGGTGHVEYNGNAGTAFSNPTGIAIDALDRIYVTDDGTGLLYRFDDMAGSGQVEFDGGANAFVGIDDVYVVGP